MQNTIGLHMSIIATVLSATTKDSTVVKRYPSRDAALVGLGESFVTLCNMRFREVEPHGGQQYTVRFLVKESWPFVVCMTVEDTSVVITMVTRHSLNLQLSS